MSDKPGLEVEIGVTLGRLQRQLAAAEARMTKTAQKMERDFGRANTRVARGFDRSTRAAANFSGGGGLRGVTLQLSQVAQQGAATGNYLQALAIQLPDLAMGFGTMGIAIGAAAGVLAPFAISLLQAGDAAEPLEDQLEALASAVKSYKDAADAASVSSQELQERFGAASAQARVLLEQRRALAAEEARAAAQAATEGLRTQFGDPDRGLLTEVPSEGDRRRAARGSAQIQQLDEVIEKLGLSEQAAVAFNRSLVALEDATDMRGLAMAATDLVGVLAQADDVTGDAAVAARDFAQGVIDASLETLELEAGIARAESATAAVTDRVAGLTEGLGAAAGEAARLAGTLATAIAYSAEVNAAIMRRNIDAGALPDAARGDIPETDGDRAREQANAARRRAVAAADAAAARASSRGGGGGGGVSEAQRAQNDLLREGAQLTERLRTQEEVRADTLARLNVLLAAGAIDQETYARALADLDERVAGSGREMDDLGRTLGSAFDSVFDSIVDGSGDASDALRSLGRELLKMGTYQALAAIAPNIFGAGGAMPLVASADGNAFSGGRVVPFARGGVVDGPTVFPMARGAGLMGEAGPEAILPLKRVNGRLGVEASGAGGSSGVEINIINGPPDPVVSDRGGGRFDVEFRRAMAQTVASGGLDRELRQRRAKGVF